jgi:hypothetical protein
VVGVKTPSFKQSPTLQYFSGIRKHPVKSCVKGQKTDMREVFAGYSGA